MQAAVEIADRVFNAQLAAHTAGRTFAAEMAIQKRRDEWVLERTADIMSDSDYTPNLFAYLIEGDDRDISALVRIQNATASDWLGSIANLHERLTKKARKIAESEASARWGF